MEENILKKEWEEWSKKCIYCRTKRDVCSKHEKDDFDNFCPPFPGCGNYIKNVDIFFLTMGHAGEKIFPAKDFDKLKDKKYNHYITNYPYDNFHSFLIRRLIDKIRKEDKTITWYLTDIWKCFIRDRLDKKLITNQVKKDDIKNNVDESFKNCKDYLIKEIEILKPKVLVLFGRTVNDYYLKIEKELTLYKPPYIIKSIFPGVNNANRWFGKSEPYYKDNSLKKDNIIRNYEDALIEDIKQKLKI